MNALEAEAAVREIPYPEGWVNKEEYYRLRLEYNGAVGEVIEKFRDWLGDKYASEFPKEVQDLIYGKAWEDGHAHGLSEVESHYIDTVDFVEKVRLLFQR